VIVAAGAAATGLGWNTAGCGASGKVVGEVGSDPSAEGICVGDVGEMGVSGSSLLIFVGDSPRLSFMYASSAYAWVGE
jgi:hypothetical protein